MTPRSILPLVAAAALAACQPAVPDSGRGVGFDGSFEAQRQARDAALAVNGSVPAPSEVGVAPLNALPEEGSAAATAAETARVLEATRPGGAVGQSPLIASPSNPPPTAVDATGISNENNFDAVANQRSIEGDAARLASNRAQYEIVQPQALPDRIDTGPNIVAYALQTTHALGTRMYRRVGLNKQARFERACAEYATPDQAQIDFLARGGPERDRQGLDPDGDGFACAWDPGPFRLAAQG